MTNKNQNDFGLFFIEFLIILVRGFLPGVNKK